MNLATFFGLFYVLSEAALAFTKRARQGEARVQDQGSLGLVWGVVSFSAFVGYLLAANAPGFSFGPEAARLATPLGIGCFIGGLALRWYAIVYLGRYFTVNVAIASDHRVIDTGPYRYIRHPSYTGALAAFLGLALLLDNALSLLVMVVPPFLVFLRRMRIEEAALLGALGEAYRAYMRRTRRLIPGLY